MKNMKIATKISIISILVLIVGLAGLWIAANKQMNDVMEASIVQQLDQSVETQAEIVRNYVDKAEAYLVGYAQAPIIAETLKDSGNENNVAKLQEYTDTYAGTGDNLENIYTADYGSTVVASHVQGVIGATLREGDALKSLQDAIAGGMYNTGIMASKATGTQVISMYFPVNDSNGAPLGYVGAAIYAQNLRDTLNELAGQEEGRDYMLLDAVAGTYIFCSDESLIGTEIEKEEILEMIGQTKNAGNQSQYFTFADQGRKVISSLYYIEERGWLLVEMTDWDTAFASLHALTRMLGGLCIIVLVVISFAIWCCVTIIARAISGEAGIIQEFGTLNFASRQKLERYCGRKDEVGQIAAATKVLVEATYRVVMELKQKSSELQKTAGKMSEDSSHTAGAIKNVREAIHEIALGAGNQASETENASNSVLHIGKQIEETKEKSSSLYGVAEKISLSSEEALGTLQVLVDINEQAKNAVEQINKQTLNTNESVQKIREAAQLITSIAEETNLLSLNASIEAARAGEQGSGFAIVAGQIKKLAEQSNDSAKYIGKIIEALLEESSGAVQVMDEVKEIMKLQSERLADTKNCFEEVGHHVEVTQREITTITKNISNIDTERAGVVDVVKSLTEIAEINAAATQESLASTETVNGMIKDVADVAKELADLADALEENICIFKV